MKSRRWLSWKSVPYLLLPLQRTEDPMSSNIVLCPGSADLEELLAHRIHDRTGRRVHELTVRVADDGVVVQGYAFSYHAVQLALSAVREVLETAPVRMDIEVLA